MNLCPIEDLECPYYNYGSCALRNPYACDEYCYYNNKFEDEEE